MQLWIVFCALLAVSQAGYLTGPAALAAPGILANPAAALAAPGILGAPGAILAANGLLAAPGAIVAPAVVPAAAHPAATLSAGGPAGLIALSAAGTPIETPAVQAGRITDSVAHATAKATNLLG